MSRARMVIGDTRDVVATIPDGSVDLVVTSPPFLALRSYLPADHPWKDREIGSEATPADFLDTLLSLTEEWGRVLAPHGSIAVELGDTFAGSGGAGGDYQEEGLRAGQPVFTGSARRNAGADRKNSGNTSRGTPTGKGWPEQKSLCFIPELYAASLAYGRNLLRPEHTFAPWRVRNFVAWVRPNPPVGALGDKWRPATSYITVATWARDRWWDDLATRRPHAEHTLRYRERAQGPKEGDGDGKSLAYHPGVHNGAHPAGAPLNDWWDAVEHALDAAIAHAAGQPVRGRDLSRHLRAAGLLDWGDTWEITAGGYTGSHYAVFPPDLVVPLVKAMCPERVCTVCGQPSRRIVEEVAMLDGKPLTKAVDASARDKGAAHGFDHNRLSTDRRTLGWSDCEHGTWRPGHVLDPFGGTGTTALVATGHGRDCTLIDIDERNADLARERLGMFLEVDHHDTEGVA